MSNKASDTLHRLIHSMSKPEKRYFKIFTSRHVIGDSNNYQVLFDAISKQQEYDEEKLLHKFRNEAFAQRFSIAKNRLYNTILKSLDSFHSNSSVQTQVKRQIHYVEILYRRSLYDQAAKLLKSVKKTAMDYELITSQIEIGDWEKRLMEQSNYEHETPESIQLHSEDDRHKLELLRDYQTLWHAKSLVFSRLYKQGKARSREEEIGFEQALAPLEGKGEERCSTVENTYLFHHLMSAYHYALGHYPECYRHLTENLAHLEKHPHQLSDEPGVYLSVLSNAIFVGMQLGKYKESHRQLEKVRKLPAKLDEQMTEDMAIRIFSTASSLELSLYLHEGNFSDGLKALPAIEEELFRYEDKLSAVKKAQFYFNIASLCFGAARYNEALKWINQLLNNIGIDQTQDVHCFAQLFNLIIHLELGNKSLVSYALRSTQRYLETRNRVYRFESVFLQFVNASLHKRPTQSEAERYQELLGELEGLKKDPHERSVFEYFDFLAWAKSKVEQRPFAEVIRSENQRSN